MSFNSLGLHDRLIEGMIAAGVTEPTAIQSLAIPPALEGKDVLGRAQDDSGKTEAFVLPLLEYLSRSNRGTEEWAPPTALILSPTRKSVQAIQAAALQYGKHLSIRVVGVFGGTDIQKQTQLLKRRTEVVVATPSRLRDHMTRGSIDLSRIEFLAIDDFDKMAELGFTPDILKIVAALPSKRQTMIFAGTWNPNLVSSTASMLREPVTVDAGETRRPEPIKRERVVATRRESRMRTLLHLLESEAMHRVIVLTQRDYEAERILRALQGKGIASRAIRNEPSDVEKDQAVSGIQDDSVRVLVGTAEAAGLLAGDGISHVISFDFPRRGDHPRKPGGSSLQFSGAETISFVQQDDRTTSHRGAGTMGQRIHGTPHATPNARNINGKVHKRTGWNNSHEGRRGMGEQTVKQFDKPTKTTKRRKKSPIVFARRKKPPKKLESFSSDHSGAGW